MVQVKINRRTCMNDGENVQEKDWISVGGRLYTCMIEIKVNIEGFYKLSVDRGCTKRRGEVSECRCEKKRRPTS